MAQAQKPATLDAVTFYDEPGVLYLPVREIGKSLNWPIRIGKDKQTVYLNEKPVRSRVRLLPNGMKLLPTTELKRRGLTLSRSGSNLTKVQYKKRLFFVRRGSKRAVVNKTHMKMSAWQGQRLVFSSPVTLGIEGHDTPSGIFEAQGYKAKLHKSKAYKNAPMPWSVHIVGNIFIHGWPQVTSGRASHGCIRLPLASGNPARFFYYWAETGTPVSILGKWPRGAKKAA
jgi:hypothetical protein